MVNGYSSNRDSVYSRICGLKFGTLRVEVGVGWVVVLLVVRKTEIVSLQALHIITTLT